MLNAQDSPFRENTVPMRHQIDIAAIVVSNIIEAVGELLTFREELLEARPTTIHRVAPRIDDLRIGQDKVDQPDVAEKASEDLAVLLRVSLDDSADQWSWAEEKALCERYLSIESARLGERLEWRWQDQSMPGELPVPRLSIQPLVENAVLHGIQRCPEGGTVTVVAESQQGEVRVSVSNPLPPEAIAEEPAGGLSLALDNIRQRMQALYGEAATLQCAPVGKEFKASLYWRRPIEEDSLTS